jgi:putative flippase GtrA
MRVDEVTWRLGEHGARLAAGSDRLAPRLVGLAGRFLRWLGELIRYWLVAFACFVLDIGALVALHSLTPLPLALDTALAFSLAAVVGFVLSRRWVFRHAARSGRPQADFTRYVVAVVAGLVVTTVMVTGLARLGLDYRLARLAASGLVAMLNFVVVKRWVFRRPAPAPRAAEAAVPLPAGGLPVAGLHGSGGAGGSPAHVPCPHGNGTGYRPAAPGGDPGGRPL